MSSFQNKRNPLYETMTYGEQLRLQREQTAATNKLRQDLLKAGKAEKREYEKQPKEDHVPPIVRIGAAECYGCACGKEFYAMRILPICPFCGVAGKIRPLGRLLSKHQNNKFKNREPRLQPKRHPK